MIVAKLFAFFPYHQGPKTAGLLRPRTKVGLWREALYSRPRQRHKQPPIAGRT